MMNELGQIIENRNTKLVPHFFSKWVEGYEKSDA